MAIDRTSKFAFVRLVESAGKMEAAQFLRDLVEAAPYRLHTVLTDNGVQFTRRKQDIWDSEHIFDRVCDEHGIAHRLTKVNHPWTVQLEATAPRSCRNSVKKDGQRRTASASGTMHELEKSAGFAVGSFVLVKERQLVLFKLLEELLPRDLFEAVFPVRRNRSGGCPDHRRCPSASRRPAALREPRPTCGWCHGRWWFRLKP